MNEQKFDEIFRDKLSGYSQQPTGEALQKLNSRFTARKRRAWLQFARLAAVLLLVAISIYVVNVVNSDDTADGLEIAEVTPEFSEIIRLDTLRISAPATDAIAQNQPEEKDVSNISESNNPVKSTSNPAPTSEIESSATPEAMLATVEETANPLLEETGDQEPDLNITEGQEPVTTKRKVTITYKKSPEPPNPMLALQEDDKNKDKRLKRIWRSISPGAFTLAGIRATKDQLVAINKKNKNKEQESKSN